MEELLKYKAWSILAVFLLLFAYEHIKPVARAPRHALRRIIKNMSFWPLNIGLSMGFILPITFLASQHTLWQRPANIPLWFSLVFDVFILDMFLYWWHRWVHEIPFFWRFHEVHHLDEHLDTTSAVRFHFGEIFFATLIRVCVIIVFAVPFTSVLLFETLVLGFTLFHHSNAALPTKFEAILSRLVITPSIHWVHHHALRKDTDSNYGTIFSFWDRLFGTNNLAKRTKNMKIGVENSKDTSFVKLILRPFFYKFPSPPSKDDT